MPVLSSTRLRIAICLALALGTLALYWPLTHYDFTNVDDPRFVFQNEHLRNGFSWTGVVWAFKSVYAETWQPLTWLTHMLDCQVYGLNAGGHHLTNLLFHVANTLLLFLWLDNLTKAPGRSAMVAALFAWHPLHVESVAWICERKDVLSAFCWLLGLLAYSRYVRKPGMGAYLLVLVLYAMALMSKPMAVTFPCVLLLIDFWPMNRIGLEPATGLDKATIRKAIFLFVEKFPFFIVGLGMTAATIYAERSIVSGLGGLPLQLRVENALVSYLSYLSETFGPVRLAYFYPYEFDIPMASVIGAAGLLAVWSAWFVLRARPQPYLLMGWLWFLGVLFPTIGFIQYGAQARADRYTYLPGIGVFIVLAWGAWALVEKWPAGRKLLPIAGGAALAACLAVSSVQVRYWQNSITLSRHAIDVTKNNYVAYESLGRALYERGLKKEAIECYNESIRIFPDFPESQYNLGVALMDAGRADEAAEHFAAVVKSLPDDFNAHLQLGTTLMAAGDNRLGEAAAQFSEAVRLNPGYPTAHVELAVALARQGKLGDALPQFAEAVRLVPTDPEYKFNYGFALLNNHQPAEAAAQFADEVKLTPNETKAHYRLAQALEQTGDFAGATREYRETMRLAPDFSDAKNALDKVLAGASVIDVHE